MFTGNYNNMAKRDRKALLIRIPTKTWKVLKRQAIQNDRTLTAEISDILTTAITENSTTTSDSAINTKVTIM